MNYNKLNNLFGWLVFAIATITYFMTIEPTTSFWDCGEYIATSVKLQVGHPPGAPFFQLMGNLFGQFASDADGQALMVNALSALSSSFSILFLFWTITALGAKLMGGRDKLDGASTIAVLGAGAVGALAYTFSDSFWFSAVEGEVYAMSSFFTAAAFWAVLKWEQAIDHDPYANKWLLLIAYLVGLSVGVHILVFLTIPAIGMIYYFKKYPETTVGGFILANVTSIAVLGLVFAFIIPIILWLFSTLEISFVNSFGLPFHSGTIAAFVLLAAAIVFGIILTKRHNKPLIQQSIIGVMLIVMGYSTFIILAIRSNANTPIDENNPEDAMSLLAYYNREQYGDWPILYGKSFNAPYDRSQNFKDGNPVYQRGYAVMKGDVKEVAVFKLKAEAEAYVAENPGKLEIKAKYLLTDDQKESIPTYDPEYEGFFPRIWNDQPQYRQNYINIMGIEDPNKPITLSQNIRFFFEYQVGKMWFRYFMWNFSGRQNDKQHRYEISKGNWITGIPFLDSMRLGDESDLPEHWENDPSRNTYFMLPFLLGLFGLIYQYVKNPKDAWAITLFFLLTGIAIVIYTNHKPFEPRERDYAFVGSFYAYAIWIGIGALGLWDMLRKKVNPRIAAYSVIAVALVAVPGRMAAENWDDHDRSNRYTARDIAKAYLDSCEPNAILFTNGDNDTFPLWYVQEVEGYRTDVRVVNLSLLNTDWYIDQQRRKAYEDGEAVPFSFDWNQYVQGTRDVVYYQPRGVTNQLIKNTLADKGMDPEKIQTLPKDIERWAKARGNAQSIEQRLGNVNSDQGLRSELRKFQNRMRKHLPAKDERILQETSKELEMNLERVLQVIVNNQPNGFRDVPVVDNGRWDAKDLVEVIKRDEKKVKFKISKSKWAHLFPQKHLKLNIDKDAVFANGVVDIADSASVVDHIDWNWKGDAITKRDLMVLDLIANNNWERPIYFSITVGNSPKDYFWLKDYFRLEGMAYRFVPQYNPTNDQSGEYGKVDTDIMYENLMTKFNYGNMELPGVYLDETNRRLSYNLRSIFGRLANELIAEDKNDKALEVLDLAMTKMPVEKFGYDYYLFGIIDAYAKANAFAEADSLIQGFGRQLKGEARYFHSVDVERVYSELDMAVRLYGGLVQKKDLIRQLKISSINSNVANIDTNEINLPLDQWLALMDALQNPSGDAYERNMRPALIKSNRDFLAEIVAKLGENETEIEAKKMLEGFNNKLHQYKRLNDVHAFMLQDLSEESKANYLSWQSAVNDVNADFNKMLEGYDQLVTPEYQRMQRGY